MLELIKYRPHRSLLPVRDWTNFFFGPSLLSRGEEEEKSFLPRVDVTENEESFVLTAETPGLDAKDVKVELEEGILKLSAEHKEEKEEKKGNYHIKERRSGSFVRSFRLPDNVDPEKIEATAKDGVLTLTIPKVEPEEPKRIEIEVH